MVSCPSHTSGGYSTRNPQGFISNFHSRICRRYANQSYARGLHRALTQGCLLSFAGFSGRRCFLTFRRISEIVAIYMAFALDLLTRCLAGLLTFS